MTHPTDPRALVEIDRSDAVNLARNLKSDAMQNPTPKGICILIDAVLAMDAAFTKATEYLKQTEVHPHEFRCPICFDDPSNLKQPEGEASKLVSEIDDAFTKITPLPYFVGAGRNEIGLAGNRWTVNGAFCSVAKDSVERHGGSAQANLKYLCLLANAWPRIRSELTQATEPAPSTAGECEACSGMGFIDGVGEACKTCQGSGEAQPAQGERQTPYANCRFQICDLPGQCKGEGKCHHPAVAAVQPAQAVGELASPEYDKLRQECSKVTSEYSEQPPSIAALIKAANSASAAGFLSGTSNWAYAMRAALLQSAPSQRALTEERTAAESEYSTTAHNYPEAPIGSRDWTLYWAGWLARSTYKFGIGGQQ